MTVATVDQDQMLTTNEAADLARCAPETVRAWVRSGRLAAFRFGPRRLVIPRHALIGLLKSQAVR